MNTYLKFVLAATLGVFATGCLMLGPQREIVRSIHSDAKSPQTFFVEITELVDYLEIEGLNNQFPDQIISVKILNLSKDEFVITSPVSPQITAFPGIPIEILRSKSSNIPTDPRFPESIPFWLLGLRSKKNDCKVTIEIKNPSYFSSSVSVFTYKSYPPL